jgi:hypothetical protein
MLGMGRYQPEFDPAHELPGEETKTIRRSGGTITEQESWLSEMAQQGGSYQQ